MDLCHPGAFVTVIVASKRYLDNNNCSRCRHVENVTRGKLVLERSLSIHFCIIAHNQTMKCERFTKTARVHCILSGFFTSHSTYKWNSQPPTLQTGTLPTKLTRRRCHKCHYNSYIVCKFVFLTRYVSL